MSSADSMMWQNELAKEKQSHDAEINRIAAALDFDSSTIHAGITIEDIVKAIKKLKQDPLTCNECGKIKRMLQLYLKWALLPSKTSRPNATYMTEEEYKELAEFVHEK